MSDELPAPPETPPVGGRWRNLYLIVIAALVGEIALLYLLGRRWA